jgi:hypothetical protein
MTLENGDRFRTILHPTAQEYRGTHPTLPHAFVDIQKRLQRIDLSDRSQIAIGELIQGKNLKASSSSALSGGSNTGPNDHQAGVGPCLNH